ncbi:hypothetical protein [Burkholderia sp. Ac-20365]|uniref:hypothetical protein n=1 Tax=Burkholderia sp. Ac-20365 TaxID=2703897 RepID=UPI00197B47FD|nr:hypothetical protein [Burkholderia sp. Ac-20365]MBN3760885.1 hypothetical protein [Burkholderia sp. Ac-20365]
MNRNNSKKGLQNDVLIIVEGGSVQKVLTASPAVRCLVLDRDDPAGAQTVIAAGDIAALDVMAQALPEVDASKVEKAFYDVQRTLSKAQYDGNAAAQRVLGSFQAAREAASQQPSNPTGQKLWLAIVSHVSVPGTLPAMFFQSECPDTRAVKARFSDSAQPGELRVDGVFDLSHALGTDIRSMTAVQGFIEALGYVGNPAETADE